MKTLSQAKSGLIKLTRFTKNIIGILLFALALTYERLAFSWLLGFLWDLAVEVPDYFRRSFCRLSQPCFFDGLGHGGGGAQRRVNEEEREALRQKLHQNWDDGEEEILTE